MKAFFKETLFIELDFAWLSIIIILGSSVIISKLWNIETTFMALNSPMRQSNKAV